jgi:hypothetical protein
LLIRFQSIGWFRIHVTYIFRSRKGTPLCKNGYIEDLVRRSGIYIRTQELHMFFLLKWLCSNNSTLYFDSVYWSLAVTLIETYATCYRSWLTALATFAINEAFTSRDEKYGRTIRRIHSRTMCPPTDDNPHMNVMLDYINMPERPSAYDVTDPLVQQAVRINTWTSTRRSVCRWSNGWQFYTMPSTTILNDQKGSGSFYAAMSWRPVKTQHGFWYIVSDQQLSQNCIFL